ncbi:MAG: glycosyltransferase family 39 protein, partial [Thermomicrobiales bacterium]
QIGWGALVATIFGMSLGVVRVSTMVMVALGALALYALLRELGVSRGRSALGSAAYLFNPLSFILAYSFMTDPFLTALIIGSTYFYVRGLRHDRIDTRFVVLGSTIAACAFLTRQQGALVPLAVVTNLVLTRRLWFNRSSVQLFAKVVAIPIAAVIGYYLWLRWFNDVPDVQESFADEAKEAGISGAWLLTRNLTFIMLMYLGFFALPLVIGSANGLLRSLRSLSHVSTFILAGWLGALGIGLSVYAGADKRWPYVPQFVGAGGLGPPDVVGSRPRVFNGNFFDWATIACAIAAILVAVLVSRGASLPVSSERRGAGIVLAIGLWQIAGVLPPSFHYIRRGFSLDRYFLPLLPIVICLLLWATKDLRLFQPIAWGVVAVFALFSVAGTRDYLVYLDTVWDVANDAHLAGAPLTSIDAGAAWDGYHLYSYGLDNGITRAKTRGGPWWTTFYGKATDSTYIVSAKPKKGYLVVWRRVYHSWLLNEDTPMYLLRKEGVSGPP